MKLIIIFLSLSIFSIQDEIMQDIGTAMKAGSSKELIKFCNQTIEIKINGESSNYSKAQAEVILKNFFTKNPPKNFNYIHQGASPEGLKYTIGRYTHEKGAFRVVMFIKKIGDKYLIDTLNFSEE
ncbi:DUF4783 domain-containing protein [Ekhidna sp.]|uniref:DUF4783 domain-containing protein n=1 Tax=Ekhidna sp. TaxID=2608089 RepID=UPI003CCBBA6D